MRWLEGRKRAGPILHVCRATARARGWVGRAPSDSISLSLPLARRQRQDVVDPEGLEVRGRGECPDPAAGYPAGDLAELASAPSPAPASSCTAIVSFSRGQAIYGVPDASVDRARARRRTPPGSAPASRKLVPFDLLSIRTAAACSCAHARLFPPPARGEKALKFRCKKLQKNLRRRGEGNAAGSYLMRTAVRAWREPGGLRFWAALGLQRALLELPFVGLGQQAGHLCAACRSGSTS